MDPQDKVYLAPFTVIVDTREQAPWSFEGLTVRHNKQDVPLVMKLKRDTLKTGDYALEGFENAVQIERKSDTDLIRTISQDRDRFERELTRLQEAKHAFIIVEATKADVLLTCQVTTDYNPKSLSASVCTFQLRYPKVHWIFEDCRHAAQLTCYNIFDLWYRKFREYEEVEA